MAEPMRHPRGAQIDELEQREFSRVRKGYEPSEVRAALVQVSAELRRLRSERGRLSDELSAAYAETERVRRENESAPVVVPDDSELTRVLGEEMVRLLDDARTTAAGIAKRAEEAAAEIRAEAEAQAQERLASLEDELAERRAEAESEERDILELANRVLAERTEAADDAAAELRAQGEAELAEAREAAREHIDASKEEGRRLVVEAKLFRERILRDLAGRRKLARKQLEAMRAAQERLLGAFTACAGAVESATSELHTALPEAKVAADDAAKRVTDDIEEVVAQMEEAMATGELPAVVMGEIGRPVLGRSKVSSPALPIRHEEPQADDAQLADPVELTADEAPDEPTGEHPVVGGGPFEPDARAADDPAGDEAEDWTELEVDEWLDADADADADAEADAEEVVASTGRGEHLRLVAPEAPEAPEPAEAAGEANPVADPGAEPGPEAGDIFARLRAERDEAVAEARETLGAAAEPADDASDAAEPDAVELDAEADDDPAAPAPAMDGETADELLDRRDDAIGPIERGVSRRVKRLVDDEQNELLDTLRRTRRNVTVAALLPEADDQVATLMELLGSELTDAVAAGAASVAARSGTPVALGRDNLERLAASLDDAVRARLVLPWREEVAALVAEESDRAALGERLRAAYRERKTVALPELASGVVVVAYNAGVAAAGPPGPGLDWVLDHGGEPAEPHLPRIRGGNPTSLLEALSAPDVPVGCRCLLVAKQR
ncbi:MAG: hypothetical protein R2754_18275 [Microthrixaceae bacterium]